MADERSSRLSLRGAAFAALALILFCPQRAAAQQTMTTVLGFLLTNKSISTEDFVQDEQAASKTRDAMTSVLVGELGTLPVESSAGGFTYRLNPALGSNERSSNSFGPFFTERSLTTGRSQASFAVTVQSEAYDHIDGQSLGDGTLVAIASTIRGAAEPFDVETISLHLRTDRMLFSGTYGLTDRLDIGAAVPFVRVALSGERVDTYRGTRYLAAAASASASGIGDVIVRGKFNVYRQNSSGVALGVESRLSTGADANLLGTGRSAIKPLAIASLERDRVAVNGNVGYSVGGIADELEYGGAVTIAGTPRLTIIGEVLGRRIPSFGRLTTTIEPNPGLVDVDTIRLTAVPETTNRLDTSIGFKWNVAGTWLLAFNVRRSVTTAGLNAGWVPMLTFDYSFAR
jgi:hypothetical protein